MESMANLDQLARIENINTHAVLAKLADVYRDAQNDTSQVIPPVTLHMKAGYSLQGHILALSGDHGPLSVLLLLHDPSQEEPTDLTYILADEIAALTIHSAVNVIEQLSDGLISRPSGPPPSIDELSRQIKTLIDEINKTTEGAMTGELSEIPPNSAPEVLQALSLTVRDLGSVLKKLADEELGRLALKERGFKFIFKTDAEAKMQIHRNHCHIFVGVSGQSVDRLSRESLRSNIHEFL